MREPRVLRHGRVADEERKNEKQAKKKPEKTGETERKAAAGDWRPCSGARGWPRGEETPAPAPGSNKQGAPEVRFLELTDKSAKKREVFEVTGDEVRVGFRPAFLRDWVSDVRCGRSVARVGFRPASLREWVSDVRCGQSVVLGSKVIYANPVA